jgi:hypothetical protein
MFMPKKAVSVTLDEPNLLWLRGRAAGRGKRSLSEALDEILAEARRGGIGGDAARSVVGTVDVTEDDPNLAHADAAVRALIDKSLGRPLKVREGPARHPATTRQASPRRKRRG